MSSLSETVVGLLLPVRSSAEPEPFESTEMRLVLVSSSTLKRAILATEAGSWSESEKAGKLSFRRGLGLRDSE